MDLLIIMEVIRIGTIAPATRTIMLVTIMLMAIRTTGGIRETLTNIGTPRPHGTRIRRRILIGYLISDGGDWRSRPAGSVSSRDNRIAGLGAP